MKNSLNKKLNTSGYSLPKFLLPYFILAITCLLFPSYILTASTVKGGEKVIITKPVKGNLYIGGGEVDIDATVTGDLFIGGGDISITDTIYRDILALGGNINLDNMSREDVRIMGGNIDIKNDVFGDLIIAGGNIDIQEGVTISGDLIIAGGNVDFDGIVKGTIRMYAGAIDFNGVAQQTAEIKADNIDINGTFLQESSIAVNELTLGDQAKFSGPVRYYTKKGKIAFEDHLDNGVTATYDDSLSNSFEQFNQGESSQRRVGFFIFRLLSAAVLIALLIFLFHNSFIKTPPILEANYLGSLGGGLLYVLIVPAIVIIGFISVIGMPAGIILALLFAITIALGKVFAAIVGAYLIDDIQRKGWAIWELIGVSVGIWLLLKLIGFIPFVGWIINILVALISYGAMYMIFKDRFQRERMETI